MSLYESKCRRWYSRQESTFAGFSGMQPASATTGNKAINGEARPHNKQLCTPASIDTIDSSNGQEDHVSMGANAATKLYRIIENCFTIQGIELLYAAQAFEFRRPLKSSPILEEVFGQYRQKVNFVNDDTYLHPMMVESIKFVKEKF
jgi:histidine ammonia-lyase